MARTHARTYGQTSSIDLRGFAAGKNDLDKSAPILPADDEQNEASARRQRCQDGEDRRDEDADPEDELPAVTLC